MFWFILACGGKKWSCEEAADYITLEFGQASGGPWQDDVRANAKDQGEDPETWVEECSSASGSDPADWKVLDMSDTWWAICGDMADAYDMLTSDECRS